MADSPTLQPLWMSEGEQKRQRVKAMFGRIADRYDLLNTLFCLGLHHRWRLEATKKMALSPGDRVADVCCGTGSFTGPLRRAVGASGSILALDFCLPMIQVASSHRPARATYALGDALRLPIASASVDGLSVGWGVRNLSNVDAGHREFFRVLKPGKRFVSVDMAQPEGSLIRAVSQKLFRTVVPSLASWLGKGSGSDYEYLPKSTEVFMSRTELKQSMEAAGFVEVRWQNLMFGNICIHWGTRP